MMTKVILLFSLAFMLGGCIEKKMRDLNSPCVANEFNLENSENHNNPCIKRAANTWLS